MENANMCVEIDSSLTAELMIESDLDEVVSIELASFSAPWSRAMFLEELSNRNARQMVFRLDGAIVGYLCFWAVLDEAHLLNIAVHPSHRSKGVGKFMMSHLESLCRNEGLKRVILEVGRRNLPARHVYRSCGFNSIGFRKRYYAVAQNGGDDADDALVMEKWLGPRESTE
jgi:ribosomal-protein-alanine N-acetyltransferase